MSSGPVVFISWSGEKSRQIAEKLRSWLPLVLEGPRLWLSSQDLPEGRRWSDEVANRLENSNFGVLVVTSENLGAPWLMFEAGALSKNLEKARVVPYLVGVSAGELSGPLSQFQALQANQEGMLRLVRAINSVAPTPSAEKVFRKRFDAFWPELEEYLKSTGAGVQTLSKSQTSDSEVSSLEPGAISKLQGELSEATQMLRQIVQVVAPKTMDNDEAMDRVVNGATQELAFLQGAWFNPQTSTHAYAKLIKGELHAPYCYGGDDWLSAVYYGWRRMGDYWFARFKWFDRPLTGFAFYKVISENELQGSWWYDDPAESERSSHEPDPMEARPGGVHATLQRLPSRQTPHWAQDYFSKVENAV